MDEQRARSDDLRIGQLAALVGVSAKAIRYYESSGLLPRPARGGNRYRRYGAADVNRLRLLRRIRLLGVPLAVAQPLLVGASDARCAEVQRDVLALVEQRLRAIDDEIAELERLRADVTGYQRTLAACHADEAMPFGACPDRSCIAEDAAVVEQEVKDGQDIGAA